MNANKLKRRLDALEDQLTSEPIKLLMPDGTVETIYGEVLDLFTRARDGDRSSDIELIARSVSSIEPGGSHMLDLARAFLNGPNMGAGRAEQGSQ